MTLAAAQSLFVACQVNRLCNSFDRLRDTENIAIFIAIGTGVTQAVAAKEDILHKLRRQIVDQITLPEVLDGEWIRFEDPVDQFRQAIQFVGGTCHDVQSPADIDAHLQQYEQWKAAERVFSHVPEVSGNVHLDQVADPHDLENLDFVIYPGEFAVAENGAIWLTDNNLRHRVVFFITQFLVLVVRKDSIVHNMHEAYGRAAVPSPGFGLFLSGPSKTADIEQSLVIGAHGCRELQVFLV